MLQPNSVVNANVARNPPATETRTSHSIAIKLNGSTIGMISSWSPSAARAIGQVYELNPNSSGMPYENVPGNVSGLTLSISRYDLWTQRLENVFEGTPGNSVLRMIWDQQAPFSVVESWTYPDGTMENWTYAGCWFSSIGRTIRSDDNRVVQVNASITYLRCDKS